MKKTFLSLLTMLVCAFGFLAKAQTSPVCSLKAKFEFRTDNCFVKFADFSSVGTGTTITNWYWDFGDASSSTLQNPTHTYAANGTYNVCLTIVGKTANGLQCKDKFCLPVTIQGCGQAEPCKLAAKFKFKTDGCKAGFVDLSVAAPGTTITSWYWDFGDATTSTLQNPIHSYASNGTYNVCLIIVGVNAAGVQCKDQFCLPVTIQGCGDQHPCGVKPLFKFKIDKCTVYFVDNTGTNPGTTITNWYWNFGDGGTSTLQNPTHTYAANGTYSVCLVVVGVNAAGQQCKNEYCFPVKIEGCGDVMPCGVKPLFKFKIDKCTVYFADNTGTNPGTTITNWYWSFGDGGTSTLQNPTHTYTANGTYTVCLVVVGVNAAGEQCKNEYCYPVKIDGCGDVGPCGVKPLFSYKIDKCTAYFTDLSGSNAGTTITNWYWTFGDGGTSTLQHPTHTYAANGSYSVCLVVVGVNAAGQQCKNEYCFPVKIEGCGQAEPCKVAAKFDYKVDGCTVHFTDYSAAGAGTTITNWYWDFGDGNTSTLQNPTHTYTASGNYLVCLVIVGVNPTTGEQCKDRICLEITVKCEQSGCQVYPKFDFKVEKCTAYFTDFSATGPGTTITNWYWEFGDGNTSTLQNPSHTYVAAGVYTVCLTIVGTNANGQQCKDRYCTEIKVSDCHQPEPCKVGAKFDFKVDKCTVYFADFSATGTGTTITNWYWDFGDGNTSTAQNPVHTYTTPGGYVVCLVVVGVNANGEQCKDKYCADVKVEGCDSAIPCGVVAKFGYKADKCNLYFTDLSTVTTGTIITSWFWDFGDGNTSGAQHPTHTYGTSGTYIVCLTITGVNADGLKCENKYCLTIGVDCGQVIPCGVKSKFDYKADKCTLYFTDYSTVTTGTVITNWYWDFGDGNTSTLQSPSHTYAAAGTYYVCLTIVGETAYGQQCKDTYCMDVLVESCDPGIPCKVSAKFDYKANFFTANFTDLSAVATGTVITNWYWDFGDGDVSTLQNPTHSYSSVGTFEVCLTIVGINVNGQQCKDTYCAEVTVDFQRPALVDANKLSSLQVYPNPASDHVNIQFKLETAGQVNITITDIQGRVLSVIQDGNMIEGYHTLNWNADVHSGMYFITIKTAKGAEQKQVVIQK